MKHLKKFEAYYDGDGNYYHENEFSDDMFDTVDGLVYVNDNLENFIPELKNIRNRLREINNKMEQVGPVDEQIEDAIDSLDIVFKNVHGIPKRSREAKKFNL